MIRIHRILIALFLVSGVVRAQDEINNLAEIEPGKSAEYITLRNTFDESSLPMLRTASTADRWTRENWVKALAAEACRLRIENPTLAAALDRPRGLDPEVYRKFRKPVPLCLRQFKHTGAVGIPLLLERWRWTFEEYPFSEGEAGQKERATFRQAILASAGQTADSRARFFLEEILRDTRQASEWRAEAALSLGMCAGEEALPALLELLDGTAPLQVRQACARALGRVPSMNALRAIQARLGNPELDRSLISALGILGSAWGWKSRGKNLGGTIRQGCAETLVSQISRVPEHAETIGRSLALVAWPPSLEALEAMQDNPAARSILPVLRRSLNR